MSFINLSQIKPYVKPSIYAALSDEVSEGVTNFDTLNPQVDYIISSHYGISVPEDDTETKYHLPAALILQRLAKNLLVDLSDDFNTEIEKDYVFAGELLSGMQVTTPDIANSLIKPIIGVDEW
ncbi:MAG TPA: hypothetical protein PL041_07695 [Melioribacteraceae bacterium]|nr:hypothetical protein [Melioribacteraceae bacterium]